MPLCTCVLGAAIKLLACLEVEGASLICHCVRGVSVEGVSLKGFSVEFAIVLWASLASFHLYAKVQATLAILTLCELL